MGLVVPNRTQGEIFDRYAPGGEFNLLELRDTDARAFFDEVASAPNWLFMTDPDQPQVPG